MIRASASPAAGAFFLALCLGIIWYTGAAHGAVIDDSASQALEPGVAMRWKNSVPAHGPGGSDNQMAGTTHILVRLNVLPWLHRNVRIYLNFPSQPPGPMHMSWSTQGRLAAGELPSGNRQLIYAGPILQPMLEELLVIQFSVDGRLLDHSVSVNYYFEMDGN